MTAKTGKLTSTGEGFYLVSVPVTGDFTLTARLSSVSALTYSNSLQYRVGLIAYDTTTSATAANIFANVGIGTDATGTTSWIPAEAYRVTAGNTVGKGSTTSTNSPIGYGVGVYLKLVRAGNVYTSYFAPIPTGGGAPVYELVAAGVSLTNRTMTSTVNTMSVGLMMAPGAQSTVQFDEITLTQP
ncbi:hypothetical protein ACDA63_17015 [Uliginosibacterium sp. sgz301328]|uniref:hypothetical protein n=1 Tax=Uliginosibacterium sp. sgz301328 TaxID=3243764 RepID=UPI00359E5120